MCRVFRAGLRTAVATILTSSMAFANAVGTPVAPPPPTGALQVWFIDVEGGQSTLFVTPDGHSLLVDTGWERDDLRDTLRIQAVMAQAHLQKLDAVLITHYHDDHVGGVQALASRVPVGIFLDHGANRELENPSPVRNYAEYLAVIEKLGLKHRTMHSGEKLPVPGFDATVVSADGKLLDHALPGGGGANAFCTDAGQAVPDTTENARSLGFALQWGQARVLDLGDLTRDKEAELMCPANKLGHVDLLVVSHHGWYQSSSRALVDAITPRVAVMDNGGQKGGSIPVLDTLHANPSHPALWQLHYSDEGGSGHNTATSQIANLAGADTGYPLQATVLPTGTITLWNGRTSKTHTYSRADGQ